MKVVKQILIRGRVQGIGYRYSMYEKAEHFGLTGWVRNRPDGSVEAMIEGESADVEELIEWAKKGPLGAKVTSVEISEGHGEYKDFSITY